MSSPARPRPATRCHQADFTGTTNPNHVTAGWPTTCTTCHTTTAWLPATLPASYHTFFPLNHGNANGVCATCHTNSSDYSVFNAPVATPRQQPIRDISGCQRLRVQQRELLRLPQERQRMMSRLRCGICSFRSLLVCPASVAQKTAAPVRSPTTAPTATAPIERVSHPLHQRNERIHRRRPQCWTGGRHQAGYETRSDQAGDGSGQSRDRAWSRGQADGGAVASTSAVCEVALHRAILPLGDMVSLPDAEVEKIVEKNTLGNTRQYPMVISSVKATRWTRRCAKPSRARRCLRSTRCAAESDSI